MSHFLSTILTLLLSAAQLHAQCLNEVAQYNPNDRTFSANITIMVVPIPKAAVQQAINEAYPLALQKPSLLAPPPSFNFPADTHPVLAVTGLESDIRQGPLSIDGPLRTSILLVPYSSRPNDATPYIAPLVAYLAGTDASTNDYIAGLIPAIASSAGGLPAAIGSFLPQDAAYQHDGTTADGKTLFSSGAKWAAVPNQLSGPGIYPSAVDMQFTQETNPKYTLDQIKPLINQPFLFNAPLNTLALTQCQRNFYYLGNQTAQVAWRSGNVTLGPSASGGRLVAGTLQRASADGGGGYVGVHGFSACAQQVGYSPVVGETCDTIAKTAA